MSAQPNLRAKNLRTWSDEQLRVAIAAEHSWRGVARALGLRPTSTVTIRRYAAQLRLDTSHFTGQRPWSDAELRTAVASATSWADVHRILGVNNSGESGLRLRGHATRLGLDVSHLTAPPKEPLQAEVAFTRPQRELLRFAAPSIATAWFELRGYVTAVPSEPQVYDLLVTFPDGIKRVQVKSSTSRARNGRWVVTVGQRPYTLDKSARSAPYDPESLDFFFVVAGDGALYLIPSRVIAGRVQVHVDSYPEYRVGDAASLLTWSTEESASG